MHEINLMIICGPGNTKDHFIEYLRKILDPDQSTRIENYHASSGTESANLLKY